MRRRRACLSFVLHLYPSTHRAGTWSTSGILALLKEDAPRLPRGSWKGYAFVNHLDTIGTKIRELIAAHRNLVIVDQIRPKRRSGRPRAT